MLIFMASIALEFASVAADEHVTPDHLTWMEASLRTRLKSLNCNIPLKIDGIRVTPVIIGQFATTGRIDLAVICVTDNESLVLIYWGGEFKCADTFQSNGQSISVVGKHYIMSHYEAYGGLEPPDIEHEGINDIILEKASVVQFCHNGTWIELTGAD